MNALEFLIIRKIIDNNNECNITFNEDKEITPMLLIDLLDEYLEFKTNSSKVSITFDNITSMNKHFEHHDRNVADKAGQDLHRDIKTWMDEKLAKGGREELTAKLILEIIRDKHVR